MITHKGSENTRSATKLTFCAQVLRILLLEIEAPVIKRLVVVLRIYFGPNFVEIRSTFSPFLLLLL